MRSITTTSCHPLVLVSNTDIFLDASSIFLYSYMVYISYMFLYSKENVKLHCLRKTMCVQWKVSTPCLFSSCLSMIALKYKHLNCFLKVISSDDSLDQSPTMPRQSTSKLGLVDFSDYNAGPYMLAKK